MAKKQKEEEQAPGSPAWMTTFGDMMSLLLCFFILIVSFSTMDKPKFRYAMGSFKDALNVVGLTLGETSSYIQKIQTKPFPAPLSSFYSFVRYGDKPKTYTVELTEDRPKEEAADQMVEDLMLIVSKMGLGDSLYVFQTDQGVRIRIPSHVLFDIGSAELKKEAIDVLKKFSFVLKRLPYRTYVEGHTDNTPISAGRFKTNWELSAVRAVNVVKFFTAEGVDPSNLAAVGFGEYNPLTSNATRAERAKNRRVELNIDMAPRK